ncbi:hypothetical protein C7212DRAFT_341753 [Tuber magnatum]|uniref:Uncharacterized protein n=1 Tax=Tuber magnatum TaxID=42249 RepID=A0A317T238_9PEZI|nr:hypothetical protein C7212DRAFT_341753 [Tuber magnatum]
MAAPSLVTEWSLDTSFPGDGVRPSVLNSNSPEKLAAWGVTSTASCRWFIHFFAHLISRIPRSESRLRNEGFIPFYTGVCGAYAELTQIAQQNQIPLPPFPAPLPDYDREATDISKDSLAAAVIPQVASQIKGLMGTMGDLLRTDQGYHWGSLAAFIGVAADAYVNAVNATKESQPTPMEHKAAPFVQRLTSENMLEACKVIREELVRCRAEAAQTGWKDDEARGLAQEFLEYFKEFPAIGL